MYNYMCAGLRKSAADLSEKAGRMFIMVVITNCHNKPDVL
jgi:hypothetical protein